MTVKITKAALNLREELADLRKPSGIAGEALLRADSVQEQRDLLQVGRKNLLLNGSFDIWQRGTSHSTGAGYKSVDRWAFNTYTGGAFTVSKEADSELGSYLKWNRTAVDTSHPNAGNTIEQTIENARYVIQGKKVTVSFWLKDEAGLGSGYVKIRMYGSPWTAYAQQDWISSGSNWEHQSFTFDMPTSITADHVQLMIGMDNGSALGGVSIAQVQLELGSVATEFEHRSYGEELALCQRYYQKSYDKDTYAGSTSSHGAVDFYGSADGTNILAKISYPVQLRTNTPTITIYNPNNSGNSGTAYIISSGGAAHYTATVNNIATSGFRCYAPKTGSAWSGHRMIFQWTADGEL